MILRKLTGGTLSSQKDDANYYIMAGIVLGIAMAGIVMALASLIVLIVFK